MFNGFSQETADFLWGLSFNNERPWFLEHKDEFEQYLNIPFKELASETAEIMKAKYPDMGLNVHVARIYRDARRLFGRGPYKDHLWFSVSNRNEHMSGPSFWFEIGAASYSRGMGFYTARSDVMERYRAAIEANIPKMERLAIQLNDQDRFVLEGEEYKRLKRDMGDLLNPWYNRKWIGIAYEENFGGDLFSPEFPKILANDFDFLMPYYQFLMSIAY